MLETLILCCCRVRGIDKLPVFWVSRIIFLETGEVYFVYGICYGGFLISSMETEVLTRCQFVVNFDVIKTYFMNWYKQY